MRCRGIRPKVLRKKDNLKNFAKLLGKYLSQDLRLQLY